jgi:hypothetical protein
MAVDGQYPPATFSPTNPALESQFTSLEFEMTGNRTDPKK